MDHKNNNLPMFNPVDLISYIYDRERQCLTWCNPIARTFWGCASSEGEVKLSEKANEKLSQALSHYPLLFSFEAKDGTKVDFSAKTVAENIYLITEIAESQSQYLSLCLPDSPFLVSIYNQNGTLIERSQSAISISHKNDHLWSNHFVDQMEAETNWQQLEQNRVVEGIFEVSTLEGVRWHKVYAKKVILSPQEWIISLYEQEIDEFINTEDALRTLLSEYKIIFENAGAGICYLKNRSMVRCNQRFAEIYGYSIDELLGQNSQMLYPNQDAYETVGDAYPELVQGTLYSHQLQMQRKDKTLFWCNVRGKIISSNEPRQGYIWIIEDINEHVLATQALQSILKEHQLILDHAMVGIVFLKDRIVTRCNRRFEELFGYDEGELQGSSSRNWYLNEEDWFAAGKACYEPLSKGEVFQGEMQLAKKDHTPLWCEVRSKAIDPNDLSQGSIWITMDISKRKAADNALILAHEELEQRVEQRTRELAKAVDDLNREVRDRQLAEERIRHMAHHDVLTGLPNRILLEERLSDALLQARQNDSLLAVLFIDLDRFKNINDTLGHYEGDQLLIEIAVRLQQSIPRKDTLCRLGGDEFVILINNLASRDQLKAILEQVQLAFRSEIKLGLQEVYMTPSIGIALYPQDGTSATELMKNADAAMYHAKDQGRNCAQFFNREVDDLLKERMQLEHALMQGLKLNQFELFYQPQLETESNKVIGAEALIRWRHPEKGLIPPAAFIPLAEETGIIIELGQWVLETACQQATLWHQKGYKDFIVSVNLSALQVQQPDFVDQVLKAIHQYGLAPNHLDLELTESLIMRNADATITTLNQLHNIGLQISVDDFGTGYSSLSYLKRFPLDKLKIDRSFVNDITTDPDDAMICRTIISMAHNLNMSVIAEGVETSEQLALIKHYGCEYYQGYYFSPPVPVHQFEALLENSIYRA